MVYLPIGTILEREYTVPVQRICKPDIIMIRKLVYRFRNCILDVSKYNSGLLGHPPKKKPISGRLKGRVGKSRIVDIQETVQRTHLALELIKQLYEFIALMKPPYKLASFSFPFARLPK